MIKRQLLLEQILIVSALCSFLLCLFFFCIGSIEVAFSFLFVFIAILAITKKICPQGFTDTELIEKLDFCIYKEYNANMFSSKSINLSFNTNRVFWKSIADQYINTDNQPFKVRIHMTKSASDGCYYEQITFDTQDSEQLKVLAEKLNKNFKPLAIELDKSFVVV